MCYIAALIGAPIVFGLDGDTVLAVFVISLEGLSVRFKSVRISY